MQQKLKTKIDVRIGGKIRAARKDLKYTIEELCNAIERSPQQLQKYETGQNRISATLLLKLSQLFGKPINWFFEDIDSNKWADQDPYQHPDFETCLVLLKQLKASEIVPEIKSFLIKAAAANRKD